jgi:hypothetical protein
MKTVVIETRGGIIQEVYTDDREARVVIVNWDDLDHVGEPVATLHQSEPVTSLPPDTREQIARAGLLDSHQH